MYSSLKMHEFWIFKGAVDILTTFSQCLEVVRTEVAKWGDDAAWADTEQAVGGAYLSGRLGCYPSLRQFCNSCKTHVTSEARFSHNWNFGQLLGEAKCTLLIWCRNAWAFNYGLSNKSSSRLPLLQMLWRKLFLLSLMSALFFFFLLHFVFKEGISVFIKVVVFTLNAMH